MILRFGVLDWAILAAYIAALLLLGLRGARSRRGDAEDFLVGGRTLTVPAFVAGLVSTWYGGILGVGEFSYLNGLSNWVVFGAPYYVFALVFALFFARKVRESASYSIPDMLYRQYGRRTGLLGSLLVYFNSSPAPYTLMLAVLLQVVTGWSLLLCVLFGTVVSVLSVYSGGFRAVARIDRVQFVLMFGGFLLLLAFLIPRHGVFPFLANALPETHFHLFGGHGWQYILVWFFIALWTLVSPQFHQFTLSAKSPQVARRGIVLSVLCWFALDGITTLSGMYARALLPDMANAAMAYPLLAESVLPEMFKGLFFLGLLATVMSTNDGLLFIASVTAGRDIAGRLRPSTDEDADRRLTRYGVLFTALLSAVAALLFPSVIELWYIIGTLFIPALLLPLTAAYYPRLALAPRATFVVMLAAFGLSLLSFVLGRLSDSGAYPLGIEPMYVGLALAIGSYAFGMLRRRNGNTKRDAAQGHTPL